MPCQLDFNNHGICRMLFQLILLFVLPLSSWASAQQSSEFKLEEIATGIFVHQGKHRSFESDEHDDIANIGFIIGDKCVAVIDTGGSLRTGNALLEAIRKKTSLPICYVINTHVHFDHVLGNIAFKNENASFIGHANLANDMAANRAFFLENYAADLGEGASEDSIVGPDQLVEETMQLDLGNRRLQLRAYHAAHSHTDLSILDEQTQTLWLSDLLFMQRIPSLDGDLRNWVSLSRELSTTTAVRVVPGHGPISALPGAAIKPQLSYLEALLGQTRKKIAEGVFMEDIVDIVGKEEKKQWLLHEQHHRRNVTKAFSELEWE